jgi:translation initiation factor IF-3
MRRGRYSDRERVNDRIRAHNVRVVDGETNAQLGVMPTHQAMKLAKQRGLDLVEVASNAEPPVCKITDFGKYRYLQEKQKKETHKQHKTSKLKELKFRIGIDPHDYLIKIVHAEDFLAEGHKIRVQLQFRGRQMAHREIGFELAERIRGDLETMGQFDSDPRMAGRSINIQITPLPEKSRKRKFRLPDGEGAGDKVAHASEVDHDDEADDDDDAEGAAE